MKLGAIWLLTCAALRFARSSSYNSRASMSSLLSAAITNLSSDDPGIRAAAATEIYRRGRAPADRAVHTWWSDPEFAALFDDNPMVAVGLAVRPATFAHIREANGGPPLAKVPPDQDAEEFELHFPNNVSLDVLTTRDLEGQGAIAKYLVKFGEGVQQVEFRSTNVDRATQILKEKFGVSPIYPHTRPGADGTRVNFFLVPLPSNGKVLVELYERSGRA